MRHVVGAPPRCVACCHLLVGLAADGACPECGAGYTNESRFRYARLLHPWIAVLCWTWPGVAALICMLILLAATAFFHRVDALGRGPWLAAIMALTPFVS